MINNKEIFQDTGVNFIKESEEDVAHSQCRAPILYKSWLPEIEEPSHCLKYYFKIISAAIVNKDMDIRKMALQNISSNPHIGPIINWFYKFGSILLSKNVYDSLTLYAVDLIEILEMSPLGSTDASGRQVYKYYISNSSILKSYFAVEITGQAYSSEVTQN